MAVAALLTALEDAFRGDPDALSELLDDDAVWIDAVGEPPLEGREAIAGHFLAHGGRRETFEVRDVVGVPPTVALRWVLRFHADAARYAHHGWALARFDGDRLVRWEGSWVERREEDA